MASSLELRLDSNPREGWGVFVKGAISDGNPNYVQSSIIAGIGGSDLLPERELDSVGVGPRKIVEDSPILGLRSTIRS